MTTAEAERPVAAEGARKRRRLPETDTSSAPTAPMRIYAFEHQPIRLLAEIEGITAAELIHRAVSEYMERHREALADIHRETQAKIAAGDLGGLAALLANAGKRGSADR
jgi:hypothetical protein